MEIRTILLAMILVNGCAYNADDRPVVEAAGKARAIHGGEIVDRSDAIVQINIGSKWCTAVIISENTLLTAAHCAATEASHYPNVSVFYQESETAWRCLTNLDASGNAIRGDRGPSQDRVLG